MALGRKEPVLTDEPTSKASSFTIGGQTLSATRALAVARKSATWFWWISGLALLNAVAVLLGFHIGAIGILGITWLLDSWALNSHGPSAVLLAHTASLLVVSALFAYWGIQARKLHLRAYYFGIGFYATDMLLVALSHDWLHLLFHAFFLVMLWGGYKFTKAYNATISEIEAHTA